MDINNISQPLILCAEEFIDLKTNKELTVIKIL